MRIKWMSRLMIITCGLYILRATSSKRPIKVGTLYKYVKVFEVFDTPKSFYSAIERLCKKNIGIKRTDKRGYIYLSLKQIDEYDLIYLKVLVRNLTTS